MPLLEIENLHVEIDGKEILRGLDLIVNAGEVHAIMGPNGSGKSTLAYVLAGKDGYQPTAGEVRFNGKNIFDMAPDERAAAGLFLAFQYPLEIPGVATMTFLRTALNAQRKKRGEAELSTPEFLKKVREVAKKLSIDQEMLRRAVNVGFSGGEKKRNEILQMALLEPRLAVLDETDSGLDIDALRIVSDGVNRLRGPKARSSSSPTTSGCSITSCRTWCTSCPRAASSKPAARIWRSSSKRAAMPNIRRRRRRECEAVPLEPMNVMAEVKVIKTAAETALAHSFAQARPRLPGGAAIAKERAAAFDVFVREGLPHRRVEEWKYTDLRALMRDAKPLASPPDAQPKRGRRAPARSSAMSKPGGWFSSTAPSCRNCPTPRRWRRASPSARLPRRSLGTMRTLSRISASLRRQATSRWRSTRR